VELNQLVRFLSDLGGGGLVKKINEAAAPRITDAILAHWAAGQDPYGNPWANLANGQRSYLFATGEMLASLKVRISGYQIVWSIDDPSQYHQYGTRRMPARKLFPDDADNPPEAYAAAVEQAFDEVLEKTFKGL